MNRLTPAGLELIRSSESLRLEAYQDDGGVWTIGYGHTANVQPGQVISKEEAERFLTEDLVEAEHAVTQLVRVPINDNQFSALVSFVYNVGAQQFQESTLLRLLNEGKPVEAAEQLSRWVHAGSAILPGLVARRQAELALFLQPSQEGAQPWRLFAPPNQYRDFFPLQTDHERQLVAWLAQRLGLRHREQPENGKVFLGLPLVQQLNIVPLRQSNDVSCGQTCVAMCINALTGKHLTDLDIGERYGFHLLSALDAECPDHRWVDGGDLDSHTWPIVAGHLPVILGLNGPLFSPSGRGHIITLTAIEADQVTFADPAIGKFRTVALADIMAAPAHPDGKFFFYAQRKGGS